MDGFRPDYLDKNITPNINYLGKMIPSFIAIQADLNLTYFTLGIFLNKSVQGGKAQNRLNSRYRPLSHGGHFESQENKKLCFCI